jgi:hypothetical protein
MLCLWFLQEVVLSEESLPTQHPHVSVKSEANLLRPEEFLHLLQTQSSRMQHLHSHNEQLRVSVCNDMRHKFYVLNFFLEECTYVKLSDFRDLNARKLGNAQCRISNSNYHLF